MISIEDEGLGPAGCPKTHAGPTATSTSFAPVTRGTQEPDAAVAATIVGEESVDLW